MDLFVLADVEGLQSKWKWFLLLGLALICLGVLSLAFIPAALGVLYRRLAGLSSSPASWK